MRCEVEEGFFEGRGEVRLFYSSFLAAKRNGRRLFVVLLHGMGEHSGRYQHIIQTFLDLSFSVVILDHRGHGKSSGQRGHVQAFDYYLSDVKQLIQKLEIHRPAIFGHSMGGLIATRFVQTFPQMASALLLSSPFLGIQMKVPGWKTAIGKIASRLLPRLSLPSEIDPHNLSHDSEIVEAYLQDPLVHQKVSARWFTTSMESIERAFYQASQIEVPLFLQQAGADLLCDADAARHFFSLVSSPKKACKIYPGFYHEIFNEVKRERPIKDLKEWVKQNCL